MSTTVIVILIVAGFSESAGRVLPLIAHRPELSPRLIAGLMVTGTVVEGTLFALWPLAAWKLADFAQPIVAPDVAPLHGSIGLAWTPALVAPLVLTAILAFPLLGPFLHGMLVASVGAGLARPLAEASGLGWWSAAGCIAVAGVGLATMVEVLRRLIATIIGGARNSEQDV